MPHLTIAVFGSSEPLPGEPAYDLARSVGSLLAESGFSVMTGGYGGVMEAASAGARAAGGHTTGVTCAIFDDRQPNEHLSRVVTSRDLFDRSRILIERASGYVVLPGKAGTLSELALLWALQRAGCLDGRPVVLLGVCWEPFVRHVSSCDMIDSTQLRTTTLAKTPADAVRMLSDFFRGGESP